MKVKKLVRHLKYNTNIILFKENGDKKIAQWDSIYLLRNYPYEHDAYMLLNLKVKNFFPSHFKGTDRYCLHVIVEDENE